MGFVFNLLGLLTLLVSAGSIGLVLSQAQGLTPGVLLALLPGLSILGSGLLFLGIGSALEALRRIARNTADTADAVESLLKKPD